MENEFVVALVSRPLCAEVVRIEPGEDCCAAARRAGGNCWHVTRQTREEAEVIAQRWRDEDAEI